MLVNVGRALQRHHFPQAGNPLRDTAYRPQRNPERQHNEYMRLNIILRLSRFIDSIGLDPEEVVTVGEQFAERLMASPALIDYMVCLNGLNLILNEHYQVIFKAFATLESEEDYQKALFHYLTKSAEMVNSDMVVANEQKELLLSANDIWDRETRHLLRKQVKREINYLRRFNTTRRTLHMIHHPKVNLSIYNSHYDKDGLHVNGRIEGIDPIDSLFGVWATNILTFENHRRRQDYPHRTIDISMRDITLNVYEMPWEFVPREEATDDYPAIHDYNSFMAAYVPTAERALREYWEDFQTDNHRREQDEFMINDYDSEGNMVYNYMSLSDMLEPYYPYRNNSSDHIDLNEYARQRGLNNDDDDEDEDSFERLPASELSRDPNIDEREPEEEQAPRRLPYLEPEEEPMCDDEA